MFLDAGQTHVEALDFIRQAFVVDAQAVEDGGVHVVDVDRVFDDVVAEFVGLAVDDAGLDAAAGHPDGEAAGVMIAAVVVFGEFALAINRSAELPAPNHQRVIQQAALFEVGDEGVASLIDVPALVGQVAGDVEMLIPTAMKDLRKANAALGQSAGQETAGCKGPRGVHVGTIHIEHVFRLAGQVG